MEAAKCSCLDNEGRWQLGAFVPAAGTFAGGGANDALAEGVEWGDGGPR